MSVAVISEDSNPGASMTILLFVAFVNLGQWVKIVEVILL